VWLRFYRPGDANANVKLLPLIFSVDVLGVSFSTVPTARRFETHFDGACVSLFASELESF